MGYRGLLLLACFFAGSASASTIEVFAGQSIQAAINAAHDGDTVLVAPGTYYEQLDFEGKAITVKSSGGALFTILDGSNSGHVVDFHTGEGTASVLQGFTFKHVATSATSGVAAIEMTSASPTIEDNVFYGNVDGLSSGSAIFGTESSAVIIRNEFLYNSTTATIGRVVFLGHGSSTVADNVFENNSAIALDEQPQAGDVPRIYNNTFVGNTAAVIVVGAASFSNNLVAFNQNGVSIGAGKPFTYNLVYGNTTDYEPGIGNQTGLDGNISADPQFANLQSGSMLVQYGSPTIDAGDASVTQISSTDYYGNPRVVWGSQNGSSRVDIGAVEFIPPEVSAADGSLLVLPGTATDGTLASSGAGPGESLVFTLTTPPTQGSVTITDATTGAFQYVPANGYLGTDSFTFTVTDPFGTVSSAATEQVTVHTPVTINVPADYATIQAAIDAATIGDTVVVAPGTYFEQLNFDNKSITVKSSGGAAATILDGNDTSPIVTIGAGAPVLQGFTLTHAASKPGYVSAAVMVGGDAPTIEDDVFMDNSVDAHNPGASAIFGERSSAVIVRNYFADNSGVDASATVITWLGGSVVVADNVFVKNPAVAFWVQPYPGEPVFFYNNTMVGNDGGIEFAGVSIPSGSRFDNNLIAFNQVGLTNFSTTSPPFSDNLVYGNTTANYQDVADQTGVNGNISVDPKLKDWANGDVHLLYGSPAIDAGGNLVTQASSTDFYGDARVTVGKPGDSAQVDIGATEYQPPVVAAVDGSLAVIPDAAKTGTLVSSGADPTERLTFSLASQPAHGTVSLTAGTGKFTYTPARGYVGSDSFTFRVKDAFGTLSNVATVSVTVNDIAPKAQAGSGFSMGGRTVRGEVRATVAYRGQVLHYSLLQPPAHGSVKVTSTGAYTYTPARGYKGRDSFTYQAIDQWGTADTAVVKVTVL